MSQDDQYKHQDPDMPWKWMSSGNGGYRMYYNGEEVTADNLETFLNQNHLHLADLVGFAHKLSNPPTPKV